MDVAHFIEELLNQEHFVYVPGLGTFLTRKTAGVYNLAQQQFYPPKNSIDFVAEEKQDEALENYISRQKNISQTAARYFIEKFVDQLKTDAVNKNIPVKEALFPQAKEAVLGASKENASFNQENFGLPPIHLPIIKKEQVFAEKETVIQQDAAEPDDTLSEEQEEISPKKSTGFWLAIFLLLAACIFGCYALYLYYPNRFTRFTAALQPPAVVHKTVPAATVKQQDTVKQATKKDTSRTKVAADTPSTGTKTVVAITKPAVKPVATDTTTTAEATDPDLVEKSPYEIIGATFKTLKGAKKFVNQLKEKGMRAKILKTTSEKHKLITFGSFQDIGSARAALDKLRARDPHSDAHIQHYNK